MVTGTMQKISKCTYYSDDGWVSTFVTLKNVLSLAQVLSLGEGEEQMKCICVNPGRLAKGEGGGTFAELNCHGSPDKMNASIIGI